MAQTVEEILLRLGFDAEAVTAGTEKMMSLQRAAARDYVGFWESTLAKKDATEKAQLEKMMSLQRAAARDYVGFWESALAEKDATEKAQLDASWAWSQANLEKMISQQRAAARDYVGVWESALAKKDATEKAQLDASWAQYQANLEKKAAADKLFFEQQAARYKEQQEILAIGAGSGGFGSGFGAGGAVGAAAGLGAAEGEAQGLKSTTALRELQTMMREIARGNWSRVLGSFTIFATAFGGLMRKIVDSMFSYTGILIAGALAGAYVLYKDIKNFSKSLDEMAKENAESIGNVTKAIKETTDKGIAAAVEFDYMIAHLADSHITLAEAVKTAVEAIKEEAAAMEKLLTARGRLEVAAISIAESSGQITHAQANAARAASSGDTLYAVESAKFKELRDEGKALVAAQKAATDLKPNLEMKGRRAGYAVSGVDEKGHVRDRAAFDRNKRMRETENLLEQIKKQQEHVDAADKSGGSDIGNWVSGALDPLANHTLWNPLNWGTNPKGGQTTKDDLTQGEKDIIERERQLLKKREEQNKNDIAAQNAAEEAYKFAVDAIKENAASLKSVNEQLAAFGTKYKDAATAMGVLKTTLEANIATAQAAINFEYYNAERVTPTVEMLAGRPYMKRLNGLYGEGGRFDLEAGNGYLSGAAQDYELAQKQQMWALEYEQNQYDPETRTLTPGSDAENARLSAVADKNILGAAGLETPEMKMDDLVASGKQFVSELQALNRLIANGVPISDDPTVPSTAGGK